MTSLIDSASSALWLAAIVFALYFIKSALESWRRARAEGGQIERLICALYAEIQSRRTALTDFLTTPGAMPVFGGHPVFDRHLGQIGLLPCETIGAVVAFYSEIDRLGTMARAYRRQLPRQPEDAGLDKRLEALRAAAQSAASLGRDALNSFEIHAPLRLRQVMLGAAANGQQPPKRLNLNEQPA